MKTWTLLAALLLSVFVSGQGVTQSIGGGGGGDGNGIYSGSNPLSSPTVVTQSGFRMTFTGGQFIAGDSTIVEIDQGKLSLIAPQEIEFHAPLVTFGPNASEWVPELAPDYLVGFDVTTGDWRRWPLDSVGGGGGSSNWQVNSGSITPLTATKLVMRDGATTTTNKLFDFRIPSNVATANADTVGVIGWSSDGTAAEKRDIIFKSAAVSFRGPNPSFRINSTASDPNVTGGSFVQERNGALQHYIQSERADFVRWNFYNGANASKLGIAGWHANFGIAIGQNSTANLAENDLMLLTRGVIGLQRKGVLFSPHTAAEMAAFTPTTEGTMVYNTTDNCYHLWDGAAWKSMCDDNPAYFQYVLRDTMGTTGFAVMEADSLPNSSTIVLFDPDIESTLSITQNRGGFTYSNGEVTYTGTDSATVRIDLIGEASCGTSNANVYFGIYVNGTKTSARPKVLPSGAIPSAFAVSYTIRLGTNDAIQPGAILQSGTNEIVGYNALTMTIQEI